MLHRSGVVIDTKRPELIHDKFTVTHVGFKGNKTIMSAYHYIKSKNQVILARDKAFQILKSVENKIKDGLPLSAEAKMMIPLKDHQVLIRDKLLADRFNDDRIVAGRGYAYIKRKPGMGKTFIALSFVEKFGRKTLYVVHNSETLYQIADSAQKLYPMLKVGKVGDGNNEDGDIIVGMITSICDLGSDWYAKFGITIIDEVPELCTAKRSQIFMRAQAPVTLAMSGTPDSRLDGMGAIAYLHFGEPIDMDAAVEEKMPTARVEWKVSAECVEYNGPPEFTKKLCEDATGSTSVPKTINMLCKDPYRTQVVVDKAVEMIRDGHTIFLMVDRREYAALLVLTLRHVLGDIVEAPEESVQMLLGGTNNEAKIVAKGVSRVCVLTYACGGVGLSYPRYNGIIFVHPRRNKFGQFNARVFRLDGDHSQKRKLVFIQDNKLAIRSQYGGFKKSLREEYGAEFDKISVDWQSVTVCELIQTKIEK